MIIRLDNSKLFTVDTALRFARHHKVSLAIWHEIWKRHLNGYDSESLAGYFIYKTGKRIRADSIRLWLIKTEIYCRANHIASMGIRAVQSEYFGVYENFVVDEALRNMKYSKSKESRTIV